MSVTNHYKTITVSGAEKLQMVVALQDRARLLEKFMTDPHMASMSYTRESLDAVKSVIAMLEAA